MVQQKKDTPTKKSIKAQELAKEQKQVSVSEFFLKNRHLLGFDSPLKALSTTIKELVDNSLDACEEMRVLPEIIVQIKASGENRFVISVEDNGPGIVKAQIPNVFARLLYGSKFHSMKQGRGQQGIGVSASVLYGQLTTGKATRITSRIDPKHPAHYSELTINTAKNEPDITVDKEIQWMNKEHGTKVEIELEGKYQKGRLSVDEYIRQSAISNPHAQFTFINPNKEKVIYRRATKELPKEPKKIKPHPYGIELGMLMRMLKDTNAKNLGSFLMKEFSRVSPMVAKEICKKANLAENTKPSELNHIGADAIFNAVKQVKIMSPPTDCLSPIGEEILVQSLKKEVDGEFFTSVTRPTAVYRGVPFQIEVAIAYGGSLHGDELVKLLRFANKVPLQYQQSACAITNSTVSTLWKNYGLQQSRGALPSGPALIMVHIASVWVPFTSESKESIAHYPEIIKELKLALQECGRQLSRYVSKKRRVADAEKKKSYIEKYIPHIGEALKELLALKESDEKKVVTLLTEELEKSRKM